MMRVGLALRGGAAAVAAVAVLLGATGCGSDSAPSENATASQGEVSPGAGSATTAPATGSGSQAAAESPKDEVKLWFMAGEQYLPVTREVSADGEPGAAPGPAEATTALLEGPRPGDEPAADAEGGSAGVEPETTTLIPAGTELIDLDIQTDGEAVVELSARFMAGIPKRESRRSPAESRELSARVGQIVHTVTQFAGISAAEIRTGGIMIVDESRRTDYTPPKKPKAPETLRPGAEPSAATRRLQQRLVQLRYLPRSAVDGIYGDQTTQAVMAFQAWQGLDRDGIAGPATHKELVKARIPKPEADGPLRRIEIHIDEGVVLLVRGGRTMRAIHASGGAPGYETPRGTFEVFRKELMSWSVPYSVWMPYASYFNGGIALHESSSVPAYPASHGCVRVPSPEAKLVYNFATMGTTVVVL